MKYLLILVAVLVVGFFVINKPYPSSIEFQGQIFENPKDQNDSLNDLTLQLYYSESSQNYLFIGKINEEDVTVDWLFNRYMKMYESQGYKIDKSGSEFIGNHPKATLYMVKSDVWKGVVSYIDISESRITEFDEAGSLFNDLRFLEL